MIVAVTYENGNIFQHFGHTENFLICEIQDKKVVNAKVIPTNGSGHGALANFLKNNNVETLICGGIGGGAIKALSTNNIKIYGGCTGLAIKAIEALVEGTLKYNPNPNCTHHEHSCSECSPKMNRNL